MPPSEHKATVNALGQHFGVGRFARRDLVTGRDIVAVCRSSIATITSSQRRFKSRKAIKNQLRELARHDTVTFVLSPMHWVDAAEDQDVARGSAKSDFMDSLQPRGSSTVGASSARRSPHASINFSASIATLPKSWATSPT